MPLKQALVINTSSAGRAGGVPEAGETEVVGKKVENEWECHVAREHKGPEPSTGEVRLDTVKAGRWEMEELVVIRVHAVLGNPSEGAINIAGVMLPGSRVRPGFVIPACPELGYCAGACKSWGWVARGP
ncbi:hypothetical protein EDD17DRAFT_1503851 [Pisolithus thermaeus]|nr:hypothetical protein EDD17DRAFT_1503851 [Pisolithus thermaeus]